MCDHQASTGTDRCLADCCSGPGFRETRPLAGTGARAHQTVDGPAVSKLCQVVSVCPKCCAYCLTFGSCSDSEGVSLNQTRGRVSHKLFQKGFVQSSAHTYLEPGSRACSRSNVFPDTFSPVSSSLWGHFLSLPQRLGSARSFR